MPYVIREGDIATGHTDVNGTAVDGTVQSAGCASSVKNGGKGVAVSATTVSFPSHAHAIVDGSPTDFRSHDVAINASSQHRAEGSNVAVDGDVVPVSDEAGPDATLVSTTTTWSA